MRLKECPHCGSAEGYFVRTRISGWGTFNYNFNGEEHEENGQLHDYLDYKEQKTAFCIDCKKKLKLKGIESTE